MVTNIFSMQLINMVDRIIAVLYDLIPATLKIIHFNLTAKSD